MDHSQCPAEQIITLQMNSTLSQTADQSYMTCISQMRTQPPALSVEPSGQSFLIPSNSRGTYLLIHKQENNGLLLLGPEAGLPVKSCQGVTKYNRYTEDLPFFNNLILKEKWAQGPAFWKVQGEPSNRMQSIILFFSRYQWLFLHILVASSTNENNCFGIHGKGLWI